MRKHSPCSVSRRTNSSGFTNANLPMSNTSRQREYIALSGLEPSNQWRQVSNV
jgi:hypothetical protein